MSKTVLNEAIWEKLLEVEKKLENLSGQHKTSNLRDEQEVVKPDFQKEKDEIIEKLEKYIQGLGTHCDSHFKVIHENLKQLKGMEEDVEGIYKILTYMSAMLKDDQEQSEKNPDNKKSYLNLKFFKIRKTSIVIVILGLLVFILTLFCMKQQNDYTLLNDEFYKQNVLKAFESDVNN